MPESKKKAATQHTAREEEVREVLFAELIVKI
jgi:hypothetical protein